MTDTVLDQLATLAEVSITLAGFASLLAVLRRAPGVSWNAFEVLSLRELILPSLAVFFLALVPPPLVSIGADPGAVFSVCSGVLAFGLVAGGVNQARVDRRAKRAGLVEPTSFMVPVQSSLYAVVVAMAIATASGFFGERTPGLYVLTLVATLLISVVAFLWFMATGLKEPSDEGEPPR